MIKFLKKNKGELTTQQIVGLIVLIVSFSIILFLIFRLNLGEITNKEICHNSVVLKSKSMIGGELDCRTSYVCISGGGKCEGINPTSTVKIEPNKEEVMKAIAKEMADCWWMFGEGKIDYIGGIHILGNRVCALCSRIAFDDSFNDLDISYGDLYGSMASDKKDSTHTYLQYIGINNLDGWDESYLSSPIEFDKQYSVLTGITKKGFTEYLKFPNIPELGVDFGDSKNEGMFIPVTILEDAKSLGCDEFLTKAFR